MLASLAVVSLLTAPQGPVGPVGSEPHAVFGYPTDPAEAMFAPFVDALGRPQRVALRAAGSADLDFDGNPDAWFVDGSAPHVGHVAVGRAQTADLGRFVPLGTVTGADYRAGVTFHRAGVADVVVLADPTQSTLEMLFYMPGPNDPRAGTLVVQPMTPPVGTDAIGIDALDPDGDGHDDLLVLRELRQGAVVVGAEVVRLHFGTTPGGYQLLSTATITLPVAVDRIVAADVDGDDTTDAVVHVPGLGVVALAIDAADQPRVHAFLPLVAGALADLTAGDLDADGDDDWCAVLADGVVVARTGSGGATFEALPRPAVVAALAGARVVDANADALHDLVLIPAVGGVLAVYPADATHGTFGAFELRLPGAATELTAGPGIGGVVGFAADIDRDGDRDLLLAVPGGDRLVALHGATHDVAPLRVDATTIGVPSAAGFVTQRFTITVPPEFFAAGFTDVEFAVFIQDPVTGESVFWDRDVAVPNPQSGVAVVQVQAMLDPLFQSWLWNGNITRHPQTNEITAFGPTVVSVHAKSGPRRARSKLVHWDGEGDPHSSAVGVRWRVVAAPPLPKTDAQLLPWD